MIVVLDTNVVVSAMLTPKGVCGGIIDELAAGAFDICISDAILDEYADILHRPHLKISREKADSLLFRIKHIGFWTDEQEEHFGLPGPDDEIFLAVACEKRRFSCHRKSPAFSSQSTQRRIDHYTGRVP